MDHMIVNGETGDVTIVPFTADEEAELRARIASQPKEKLNKRVVVERLNKAGLLAQAFTALGGPGALAYERWSASTEVDPDNADVLALLNGIGADVSIILRSGVEV